MLVHQRVISPIILGPCEALAARQDAKPPRVKAFVTYGYTPAAGALVPRLGIQPFSAKLVINRYPKYIFWCIYSPYFVINRYPKCIKILETMESIHSNVTFINATYSKCSMFDVHCMEHRRDCGRQGPKGPSAELEWRDRDGRQLGMTRLRWFGDSECHRIHGAAIYGAPWIPSIYPLYVSIYTSTMDPMGMLFLIIFHHRWSTSAVPCLFHHCVHHF